MVKPPVPPVASDSSSGSKPAPPPAKKPSPPKRKDSGSKFSSVGSPEFAALMNKMENFYRIQEPEKMDHDLEPIVLWGLQVGEALVNETLQQLYGCNLDTVDKNRPPSTMLIKETPSPSKPPPPAAKPALGGLANALQTVTLKKAEPVAPPTLRLDRALGKKPEPPQKPSFMERLAKKKGIVEAHERGEIVVGSRKRSPSEGACEKYTLDMTGDSFGVCTCGFAKALHGLSKQSTTRVASIRLKSPIQVALQACNHYRVDLSGKYFGDCVCGWPKKEHGSVKPSSAVPSSLPGPSEEFKQKIKKEAIIEKTMEDRSKEVETLDLSKNDLIVHMVESYEAQHQELPSNELMATWLDNVNKTTHGSTIQPSSKVGTSLAERLKLRAAERRLKEASKRKGASKRRL